MRLLTVVVIGLGWSQLPQRLAPKGFYLLGFSSQHLKRLSGGTRELFLKGALAFFSLV